MRLGNKRTQLREADLSKSPKGFIVLSKGFSPAQSLATYPKLIRPKLSKSKFCQSCIFACTGNGLTRSAKSSGVKAPVNASG